MRALATFVAVLFAGTAALAQPAPLSLGQRTPIGGTATIGTTDGTLIPSRSNLTGIRYQVQGTGYACVSWVVGTLAIAGTDATAKCSGPGAFLVTAGVSVTGSTDGRFAPSVVPLTPLHGIATAGASLQLVWEAF